MKASRANIDRALETPNPDIRFYLFCGPDEAHSRSLASRLLESLGATKFVIPASALKTDPASLVHEANAMSLFGGKRTIWIEPATKDIEEAVVSLLEAPPVESAVVGVAGALPKSSALLKLSENSRFALAFASYVPEGQEAERMVIDIGRRVGLKIAPPVAARLADTAGNDRAIVGQELEKLAIFLDASPQSPKVLDHSAIDEIGVDHGEGNFLRLADLALAGEINVLADELTRLPAAGSEAIPVIRSLQRRLLMLAPLRARVERGESIDAVMTSLGRALFFKDKAKVQRMLAKWSAADLATVGERAGKLERALMFTDAPDRETLGEELLAIARKARSSR